MTAPLDGAGLAVTASQAIVVSTVLLAIVVAGGLALAAVRFGTSRRSPEWLAKLHGLLAAVSVSLLTFVWGTVGLSGMASLALTLAWAAVITGAGMGVVYSSKGGPTPEWLVFAHLSLAATAFILLLAAALGQP